MIQESQHSNNGNIRNVQELRRMNAAMKTKMASRISVSSRDESQEQLTQLTREGRFVQNAILHELMDYA